MTTDVTDIPTGTSNSDDLSEQQLVNEAEVRELVYQSLENDGILSRLKAELRVAVFKTIEKATNPTSAHSHPPSYDSINGRVCRALVLDWLEHSRLLYTEDVLKMETTGPNHPAPLTHAELVEQLHIKSNQSQSQPLLHVLINQSKNTENQVTVKTVAFAPRAKLAFVPRRLRPSLRCLITSSERSAASFPRRKSTISLVCVNIFGRYSRPPSIPVS